MNSSHQVVIVGGGNAGISVAARLKKAGIKDIAIIEPSETHYYQPLWTLIGGGRASIRETSKPQAKVIPKNVRWIRDRALGIDPEKNQVQTHKYGAISYDYLVMAAGIQLDFDRTQGLPEALKTPQVSSIYTLDSAQKTWNIIRNFTHGKALFMLPPGAIKCAGAPQKITYLAADYWRQQGVLQNIDVTLVLPGPTMFSVPVFAEELDRVVKNYGISVKLSSEIVSVDGTNRTVIIRNNATGTDETLTYDLFHAVPQQSAPDWVKATPLANPADPNGYVEVNKHTLQHVTCPNVFALGDVGSSPNSKTGAAIRKQAPVLVENLVAAIKVQTPTAHYDGYASCPLVTARDKMLLAEFNYEGEHTPSLPIIDTTKERKDMWLLKRYGLPFLYWNGILKGRA